MTIYENYGNKLYCLMDKETGEYITDDFDVTNECKYAIGWKTKKEANKVRKTLDEPRNFKIVVKHISIIITKA